MLDPKDIKTALGLITVAYPTFRLMDQTIAVWHAIIGHHDRESFFYAVSIYMGEAKDFPPTPGHINQLIRDLTRSNQDRYTTGEAWDFCVGLARRGLDEAAAIAELGQSPRVAAALKQTGWHRIRYADEKEISFVMRDFAKFYNDMKDRDVKEQKLQIGAMAQQLIGMAGVKAIA